MPAASWPGTIAPLSLRVRSLPESQFLSPIPAARLCVRLLSTESMSPAPGLRASLKLVQQESHRPPLWSYQGRVPFPLLEEDPPSCLSLSSRTGVKPRRSWFSLVSKVSAGDTAFLSSLQRMGQGPQGFSCSEKLPLSSWGVSQLLGGSKALFRPHSCGYYSRLIFSQLCSLPRRPSLVLSIG